MPATATRPVRLSDEDIATMREGVGTTLLRLRRELAALGRMDISDDVNFLGLSAQTLLDERAGRPDSTERATR